MAAAGQSNTLLGDLVPFVIDALQGRTDVADIIPKYIKKAVTNFSNQFPFPELERTGPTVQLTTGVYAYPVNQFLVPGDDYTFPNSFGVYVDYPNNTVVGLVKYRTPKGIETMLSPATVGIPSKFTRYGPNFHFGPVPNNPLSVFLRYQVRHPWPDANDSVSLLGATIYLPDDWVEVAIYSAAERVAFTKRWNDQSKACHDILFGDPMFQASGGVRGRPGLLTALMLQQERDETFDERQLGIQVPHYNPR